MKKISGLIATGVGRLWATFVHGVSAYAAAGAECHRSPLGWL